MYQSLRPGGASRSTTSASSPTASPCAKSACITFAIVAARPSTKSCASRTTRSARRSRTSSTTRASIMEPAGALSRRRAASAGPQRTGSRDARPGRVLSGANMNFDRLRFVAERAELGEAREALFGGDHPGAARRLSRVLRRDRPARRHRVQLPAERPRGGAHLRRRRARRRARTRRRWRATLNARGYATRRPHRQRDGQAARPPHGRRPQPRRAARAALPVRVPGASRAR